MSFLIGLSSVLGVTAAYKLTDGMVCSIALNGPLDLDAPLARQAESIENAAECIVCLENAADHAFIPCGHVCICGACADVTSLDACPLCRSIATGKLRVYLSC